MKKKNSLLAVTGLAALSALFAFTYPTVVRENVLTLFFPAGNLVIAQVHAPESPVREKLLPAFAPPDTNPPLQERYDDFLNNSGGNIIDLQDPKAIEQHVDYDPETNMYIITEKIGDDFFRAPTYMTFQEYTRWRDQKQQQEYFDRLQGVASVGDKSESGIVDPIAKFNIKHSLIDRLFGGTTVDIRPQGNINLTFGYQYQRRQNPILTLRQQGQGNFDFDMDINMSATGKIGEKLNLNFNYNTQATFDFDNQMKLNYDTKGFSEDEIIQGIEAGNVSLPLRSNLIKGAQNLFGLKMDLKFGHLRTTLVASQQRSKQQNLAVQGGSQLQTFEKPIDEYDENRHFFLSHWNRREFEPTLRCLPVPLSLFTITQLQVWITNDKLVTENTRDIVALTDLGEPDPFNENYQGVSTSVDIKGQLLPDNDNNTLYPQLRAEVNMDPTLRQSDKVVKKLTNDYQLKQIRDFEKVRARLLSPAEYTYNDQLGFISLNLNVQPDQVVGVTVAYTYNGQPHKIGELAKDVQTGDSLNQNVLFVKMLKSTTANVNYPIWDLMMKNIYAIGSANVDPQEFRFDVFYEDPGKGQKRFLDGPGVPPALKSKPLLQVFRLDTLNLQQDPGPDGIFDFIPGLTINLRSGRVMFPVLEPFGSFLNNRMKEGPTGADTTTRRRYVYPELYDSTLFRAREFQQYNRFTLKGSYKSATSAEISLGTFNLPQGSVRVSAGGRQLIEGQDYSVDYNIGKVRILNDAILQSGQNVSVSFEDNSLFGFQSRSMVGARFDYDLSRDVKLGATFMNLFERPLTQKVNFGDDPINNKVYGLDFSISKDAPWITKFVDWLPFLQTKEKSTITAQAEVALLDPGHNRAINQGADKGGTVYLDDFEGSTSNLRVDFPANSWVLASVPQGDPVLFPESVYSDSLVLGANRARLSWYNGDSYVRSSSDDNNPYTLTFNQQDIFPNRQLSPAEQSILRGLDVTYFPQERGPYNFELPDGYGVLSAGFQAGSTSAPDGEPRLAEPETRWGGFMKGLNTNDFESANIEFVEFWMLNPYMDAGDGTPVSRAGNMYIDLGSVSEDIMRDSRQFFENAIPTGPGSGATVNTRLGRIPVLPPVVNAFDNDPDKRVLQDVGLDGLNDDGERSFFNEWVQAIEGSNLSGSEKTILKDDPSADNFVYFGDARFQAPNENPGLIERYRRFNSPQGNSPVNTNQGGGFFNNPSATNIPDGEDLNRDNSLNESESYYRYKIPLIKRSVGGQDELDITNDSLKDIVTEQVVVNKNGKQYIWYRFKVPLDAVNRQQIGGIQDFRSIRFMRMLWKGFDERTTFRFATLELGRNQWRRFTQPLPQVSDSLTCDQVPAYTRIPFDVNAVSIEENAARQPFNYTIPYGISREQSVGAFPDIQQNEQALSLNICDLVECDARGIYKPLNMDLRQFKQLKMFVHAEGKGDDANTLDKKDMTVFLRLGSDFIRNYYEYEIHLAPSKAANLNGNPDSRDYKEEVWKPENSFDFPLELLTEVKKRRNADTSSTFDVPFIIADPNHPENSVKVVGNPNLGYVKGVMVGVRNVDHETHAKHCVEVWINELRLNGFNEQGGYAGQARVDLKLADFGNISLAGNYSSIGWGSLEEKLIQRQREEIIQYDLSTNLELGKLLPEKVGLRIPFYAQYTNVTKNPEYDPYDLDIKLKDKIRNESDAGKKQQIRDLAQDVTVVRGFNFTNVRKERRGKGKPMPWDISNFSLTYAYNQEHKRDPFTIRNDLNRYKGGLDYQYATGIQPIQPFKGVNNKYLKFIKEFNFNPLPNTYGFNTVLDRYVGVRTDRFAGEDPKRNTYYNRRFTWDRNYDLGWDITRALRFNFDANARSLIDEPMQYAADGQEISKTERRDSIMKNIRQLGRPKAYTHNASLNYTLPFKYFPFLDFITMKASYTAGYTWTAQALKLQNLDLGGTPYQAYVNERNLGNTIQNTNVRQINGEFNFETLYNKSKYLGRINKPGQAGNSTPGSRRTPSNGRNGANPGDPRNPGGPTPEGGAPGGRTGKPGDLSTPGGKDPTDKSSRDPRSGAPVTPGGAPGGAPGGRDPGGKPADGKVDPNDPSAPVAGKDSKDSKDSKAKKPKKERQPSMAERIALRPIMLIRRARFTYSENFSTVVPGFTPEPKLMGLSEGWVAPGWEFVAGIQPSSSWLDQAARRGWITHRPELNQQVLRNYTQNIDASVSVEPFTDFKVDITAAKQYTRNSTELFKDQNFELGPDEVDFQHRAQRDFGSYNISYFALNTLFNNDIDGLFTRFKDNRTIISERLAAQAGHTNPHQEDPGYKEGYGKFQQEVLLPAFVAAYTDKDAHNVGLNVFRTRPAVNWKVNYAGLSKLGKLKNVFSSFTITHGYKSNLTLNSFNTDIFYDPGQPTKVDELNFNYIARYEIPQVLINEQFQPLLGVQMKMKNGMSLNLDFKKSRTLAMSFVDYQLAEGRATGYSGEFGYLLKNVNIPFLTSKAAKKSAAAKKKAAKKKGPVISAPPGAGGGQQSNDMNFKFTFEYRDEITVNHQLDQRDEAIPTRGNRTIKLSPSVDYALNKRLSLRVFTDYSKTVPKTSQSFPITTVAAGVTVQFKLN